MDGGCGLGSGLHHIQDCDDDCVVGTSTALLGTQHWTGTGLHAMDQAHTTGHQAQAVSGNCHTPLTVYKWT